MATEGVKRLSSISDVNGIGVLRSTSLTELFDVYITVCPLLAKPAVTFLLQYIAKSRLTFLSSAAVFHLHCCA